MKTKAPATIGTAFAHGIKPGIRPWSSRWRARIFLIPQHRAPKIGQVARCSFGRYLEFDFELAKDALFLPMTFLGRFQINRYRAKFVRRGGVVLRFVPWYDVGGAMSARLHMPNDKPAHEVRLGAIKATIWKNDTGNGVRFNTTFTRLYRDGSEWKNTSSFGRDDLLVVGKVADQVHSWICEQRQEESSAEDKREKV